MKAQVETKAAKPAKVAKTEKPAKVKSTTPNPMRKVFIEKVLISAGATGDNLKKSRKLLEIISGKQAQIIASRKRIPAFSVNPGLEVGVRITVRGEDALVLLRRLLGAVDNKLKKSSIAENHISFGIKEYIEIPGMEYQRDIGVRGLNVTVVFSRAGLRVARKKIKMGHVPQRQHVTKQEVINHMEEQFKSVFV
jgi:large subunit ribosomal protein L5